MKNKIINARRICFLLFVIIFTQISQRIEAQIVPDRTLGTESSTLRSVDDLRDAIEGGAIRGENLFHSFEQFNVNEGARADFATPEGISNIFSRVTGNNASEIFGTLGVNGTANLFLMNPNGIVFGENAAIDIGGSFIATTAQSIEFSSGEEFSAANRKAPLLTINFPIGFNFNNNSGAITVNGMGNKITPNFVFTPITVEENTNSLSVKSGNTLALIGNEINFDGATINASSGRIELASVSSGLVNFQPSENGFSFNYDDVANYQDITLDNLSVLNASGSGRGNISLNAANVAIEDGSLILIRNQSDLPSGIIDINATESLNLFGTSSNGNVSSNILSEALGSGKAADLNISTRKIVLRNGSGLGSVAYADASSGNVNIDASDFVQLQENTRINPDRFSFVSNIIGTAAYGNANAGDLNLTTSKLNINDGGAIVSSSGGIGNSGSITVNAERINISGINPNPQQPNPSGITATANLGNAGNITINTSQLQIQNGGSIDASNVGTGDGGELKINASRSIDISGENNGFSSVISSNVYLLANEAFRESVDTPSIPTGQGGNLTINTPILNVNSGGEINVANEGSGNAGILSIDANQINLDNSGSINASTASGQGGNIIFSTDNLELLDRSQITASAGGQGDGGNITINSDTILGILNSDITANAIRGNGGNIVINSDFIVGLEERGELTPLNDITATSEFGIDGTVEVNAPENNLDEQVYAGFRTYSIPQNRELLETRCLNPRNPDGKILNIGRAGVPESPDNFFDDEEIVAVEQVRKDERSNVKSEFPVWVEGDPIVTSNAVKVGRNGEIYFVAETRMEDVESDICTREAENNQ